MPSVENVLLAWAIWYAGTLGWSVIPIDWRGTKKPKIQWKQEGCQEEPATAERLREWWGRWPEANVGIVTGAVSGIVVVDVEGRTGWSELCRLNGGAPDTPVASTPGGGWHIYFAHPGEQRIRNKVRLAPEIDLRADGGYVLAPPSRRGGRRYEWVRQPSPRR